MVFEIILNSDYLLHALFVVQSLSRFFTKPPVKNAAAPARLDYAQNLIAI